MPSADYHNSLLLPFQLLFIHLATLPAGHSKLFISLQQPVMRHALPLFAPLFFI